MTQLLKTPCYILTGYRVEAVVIVATTYKARFAGARAVTHARGYVVNVW